MKQVMLAAAQEELNVTNGESNEAQRALMKNGITSPMGHGTLESLVLVPARMARRMADQWERGEWRVVRGGDFCVRSLGYFFIGVDHMYY